MKSQPLTLSVNGEQCSAVVEARTSLADFLRDGLNRTGTHLGCEHGICGACTVFVDDEPVRACLTLAVSLQGRRVTTVEGLEGPEVDAVRKAFHHCHALQCGFCTPGMLATAIDMLRRDRAQDEAMIREELAGNLCRCTGYSGLVNAILEVAGERRR